MIEPLDARQMPETCSPETACSRGESVPRRRVRLEALPVLRSPRAILRELEPADAPSLLAVLQDEDVQRFLPPGPATGEAVMEFIRWTRRAQRTGRHLSFGVVPHGLDAVVGVFQIWPIEPCFETAEWGFALGRRCWGTGLFAESAAQVVNFAIDQLGVRRLEARAAVDNIRGNAALEKLGAMREGILRQCFRCDGEPQDHVMWAILRDDWHRLRKA